MIQLLKVYNRDHPTSVDAAILEPSEGFGNRRKAVFKLAFENNLGYGREVSNTLYEFEHGRIEVWLIYPTPR